MQSILQPNRKRILTSLQRNRNINKYPSSLKIANAFSGKRHKQAPNCSSGGWERSAVIYTRSQRSICHPSLGWNREHENNRHFPPPAEHHLYFPLASLVLPAEAPSALHTLFLDTWFELLMLPSGTQSPRYELFTPPRPAIVPWLRWYGGWAPEKLVLLTWCLLGEENGTPRS